MTRADRSVAVNAVALRPTELLAMPYQTFRTVVEQESKSQVHPATAQALREPSVLRRWYEVLIGLQRSVEGQLASIGAEGRAKTARLEVKALQIEGRFTGATLPVVLDERRSLLRKVRQDKLEAEADLEQWRAAAVRWKTRNEERLTEVRFLLREQGDEFFMDRVAEERNRALARTMELETALKTWRDSFSEEDEPTAEDMELMRYV